jgi:hypothetical protein
VCIPKKVSFSFEKQRFLKFHSEISAAETSEVDIDRKHSKIIDFKLKRFFVSETSYLHSPLQTYFYAPKFNRTMILCASTD